MSDSEVFCRQIRERSAENREAVRLLHGADLMGSVISVLRQELDSLVRVIYLLSIQDRTRRSALVSAGMGGSLWRHPSGGRVTDKEMVDLAARLHGWTGSVYRFGCAFIHLSAYHDYRDRDPMTLISDQERRDIVAHLRSYHGGPRRDDPPFEEVSRYLPRVFEKVASNLEHYVTHLEAGKDL